MQTKIDVSFSEAINYQTINKIKYYERGVSVSTKPDHLKTQAKMVPYKIAICKGSVLLFINSVWGNSIQKKKQCLG